MISAQQLTDAFHQKLSMNLVNAYAACYQVGVEDAAKLVEDSKKRNAVILGSYTKVESGAIGEHPLFKLTAELLKPMRDHIEAAVVAILQDVKELSGQKGKFVEPSELANVIRNEIKSLWRDQPVTIQRPGKRPVQFTVEAYADVVARTTSYAVRNQAYINTMKANDLADGWVWIAMGDERTCEICGSRHGKVYSWNDPAPPAHPGCRCRPIPHYKEDLEKAAEGVKKEREAKEAEARARKAPAEPAV
ncbi:MAG TPA: minor capsid protein [Methanothrix sp.]|nr:minor capsid protein [Methanothrix sp.]HOK59120.1 minor capsid protein [Methanothrix sp.]HOL44393.1 minor capsid protein [Methanothrix sp.]